MKIKHYAIFNLPLKSLNSPEAWDALRSDNSEPQYHIPIKVAEYKEKVDESYYSPFAEWIVREAEKGGFNVAFSVGSGKGYLEYQVKKLKPSLDVVVSDYTSSILHLEKYEIFDGVFQFDIFNDHFPVDKTALLIFPRIDTEFTDEQLIAIIKKCYDHGFEKICFIPGQLLSLRIAIGEVKTFVKAFLKRRRRTFCGYSRTTSLFRSLMIPYYEMTPTIINQKKVFVLNKKK